MLLFDRCQLTMHGCPMQYQTRDACLGRRMAGVCCATQFCDVGHTSAIHASTLVDHEKIVKTLHRELWLKHKSLYRNLEMTLKSFNAWVIYRIKSIKLSMVTFILTLESVNEIWANFEFFCSYGVIMRDKVGNFGKFDDKTLFGNKSNLHTKVQFTHNISRWAHSVRPAVSRSAIEWSTHSVVTVLAGQKVEICLPKLRIFMRDQTKFISLSSLGTWSFITLQVEGTKFLNLQTMPHMFQCLSGLA